MAGREEAGLKELLLETSAKLFGRSDGVATQRCRLRRYFPKCPQEQLEPGLKWLKKYTSSINYNTAKVTVAKPICDGEEHAGTWAGAKVGIEWHEGLRRLVLVQDLAKITTLTTGTGADKSLARAGELVAAGYGVQSVWDVTDQGGETAWARSGVDLVTVVEGVDPASRGLVEADSTAGIQAADLVSAFGLSNCAVTRRVCEPSDDGATMRVVLGWARNSGKTWAAQKQLVGARDEGGHGLAEMLEVRGLTPSEGDTAWTAAASAASNRVCAARDLLLSAGRAVVRQTARITYSGTGDADATLIKIRAVGDSGKGLVRVWPRRGTTAKDTLTGSGGKAVSAYSYTFPGDGVATSLVHVECTVDDHGDGSWTVMQILAENALALTTWATGYTYYYTVRKMFTRATDDDVKLVTYTKYVAMRSTEKAAWDAIHDWTPGNGNTEIVEGSDGVVQKGKYQFLATWLTLDVTITTGGVTNWGALPAAAP